MTITFKALLVSTAYIEPFVKKWLFEQLYSFGYGPTHYVLKYNDGYNARDDFNDSEKDLHTYLLEKCDHFDIVVADGIASTLLLRSPLTFGKLIIHRMSAFPFQSASAIYLSNALRTGDLSSPIENTPQNGEPFFENNGVLLQKRAGLPSNHFRYFRAASFLLEKIASEDVEHSYQVRKEQLSQISSAKFPPNWLSRSL